MQQNKSKLIIGIVLVVVGGGLLAWTLGGRHASAPSSESSDGSASAPAQTDTGDDPNQAVSTSQSGTTVITFTNDGFTPNTLTVKKGTAITVKNESSKRVQFSSDDHPTHRLNTEMNLAVLAPGESASFVAETVGEHGFHDHIDDSKTGTITVTE